MGLYVEVATFDTPQLAAGWFIHCTFMDNLSHLLDDKIIPYSKRGNVCGKTAVVFQCNNL